jgi:hypothetical protein
LKRWEGGCPTTPSPLAYSAEVATKAGRERAGVRGRQEGAKKECKGGDHGNKNRKKKARDAVVFDGKYWQTPS